MRSKLNVYTLFWNFVALTLLLFKLNTPLQHWIPSKTIFYIVQIGLFYLCYCYVSPYLSKLTECFCQTTKVPIQLLAAIYVCICIVV